MEKITFEELTKLVYSSHGKWDNLKNKLSQFSNKWTKLKNLNQDNTIIEIFLIKNKKLYSDSDQYLTPEIRYNFKSKRERILYLIKNGLYIDGIFAYGANILIFYIIKYENSYAIRLLSFDDDLFELRTKSAEAIDDIKKMISESFKTRKLFNQNIVGDIYNKYNDGENIFT